jgi:hypothetical protein
VQVALATAKSPNQSERPTKRELRDAIREAIVEAFYATHEGFSIDWLLSNPTLQKNFHLACHDAGLIGGPAEWNRELLRFRKTGAFPNKGSVRRVIVSATEMDEYIFAAEISWRIVSEQFDNVSLDEILCDPAKASVFDSTATRFGGRRAPEDFRWAALHLRKAGKDLVRNVNKYRNSALKGKDFGHRQDWLRVDFDRFRNRTGVYQLNDDQGQSLYVGHCFDLGGRLERHSRKGNRQMAIDSMSIVPFDRLPGEVYREPLKVKLAQEHNASLNVDFFSIKS